MIRGKWHFNRAQGFKHGKIQVDLNYDVRKLWRKLFSSSQNDYGKFLKYWFEKLLTIKRVILFHCWKNMRKNTATELPLCYYGDNAECGGFSTVTGSPADILRGRQPLHVYLRAQCCIPPSIFTVTGHTTHHDNIFRWKILIKNLKWAWNNGCATMADTVKATALVAAQWNTWQRDIDKHSTFTWAQWFQPASQPAQ